MGAGHGRALVAGSCRGRHGHRQQGHARGGQDDRPHGDGAVQPPGDAAGCAGGVRAQARGGLHLRAARRRPRATARLPEVVLLAGSQAHHDAP